MNTSFYNGVSGIKTHQFGIDITANNISNVNTAGYRASRAEFATIFNQNLVQSGPGFTTDQVGVGARAQATELQTTQGPLTATENDFDLAIGGNGLFGVKGINGETLYTRNGAFNIDANGNLVDDQGRNLMGVMNKTISPTNLSENALKQYGKTYSTNELSLLQAYTAAELRDIGLENTTEGIKLPKVMYLPPTPTTKVSYQANLDPKINIQKVDIPINKDDFEYTLNEEDRTLTINGDIAKTTGILNPKENDEVLLQLKDKQGRTLNTLAKLNKDNKWELKNYKLPEVFDTKNPIEISATLRTLQETDNSTHLATDIFSPKGNKNILDLTFKKRLPQDQNKGIWDVEVKVLDENKKEISTQNGEVAFNENGALIKNTIGTIDNDGVKLDLNLGSIYDPKIQGSGYNGIVSTGGSTSTKVDKNGFTEGLLDRYTVDNDGNIVAVFSNNKTTAIAKVAIYHFQNEQGLAKMGNNVFSQTSNSGQAMFYTDKNGKLINNSIIKSRMLEMSNVSLATALTELIVYQKGYDASAKSITTSDQMIRTAIEMKK